MVVSSYTPEDEKQLCNFWDDTGLFSNGGCHSSQAELNLLLAIPDCSVFILKNNGIIKSTATACVHGNLGRVWNIAVQEAEIGNGYRREVIIAAEKWLATQGAIEVQLFFKEQDLAADGTPHEMPEYYQSLSGTVFSRTMGQLKVLDT